jgi:hypothetical protein
MTHSLIIDRKKIYFFKLGVGCDVIHTGRDTPPRDGTRDQSESGVPTTYRDRSHWDPLAVPTSQKTALSKKIKL